MFVWHDPAQYLLCYIFCTPMIWFASFTVLLMVAQTPVPVPRQTPNGSTTSSNTNSQGQGQNAPPAPSVTVVQPSSTPKDQTTSGQQSHEDATHSVAVRELPTVSISKDWADRGVWWFSLCLVIVGALQ